MPTIETDGLSKFYGGHRGIEEVTMAVEPGEVFYAPLLQSLLGTAALAPHMLLFTCAFPFIVCGADELRRWLPRRLEATGAQA